MIVGGSAGLIPLRCNGGTDGKGAVRQPEANLLPVAGCHLAWLPPPPWMSEYEAHIGNSARRSGKVLYKCTPFTTFVWLGQHVQLTPYSVPVWIKLATPAYLVAQPAKLSLHWKWLSMELDQLVWLRWVFFSVFEKLSIWLFREFSWFN